MGRVTDWVVSSTQLCTSCLSPNDDERPPKAKTRNRRFWMVTKVFRSKAVVPEKEIKISMKTPDKNNSEAPKADKTKLNGNLEKLRGAHLGRPLPDPSPNAGDMFTKSKSQKPKGTTPCKGCVNAQHDPRKIRQRLSSKLQNDKRSGVDDSASGVGGPAAGCKIVLKQIDTEVLHKVDKVFGSSVYRNEVRSSKCNTTSAKGGCRRTRRVSPTVSCGELMDVEVVPGPEPSLGDECGEKSKCSKKGKHRKIKTSRNGKARASDEDMFGERRRITEVAGYQGHGDDDDIVCCKPDISSTSTNKHKENTLQLEVDVYEFHDDHDDIVCGILDTVSKHSSAAWKESQEKAQTEGYESHDDDDDIVFGKPDQNVGCHLTALAKTSDNKHGVSEGKGKAGFVEIIKSMSETLDEMERTSSVDSYERNHRDMVNMLSKGSVYGRSIYSTQAIQTNKPQYDLVIKELADKIGEMKSSGCDSQTRNTDIRNILQAGDIRNLKQFQSRVCKISK